MSQEEFDRSLKQLGDLYEEGKDCLHNLSILAVDQEHYSRVFDIIRELRDIAAVSLKDNLKKDKP